MLASGSTKKKGIRTKKDEKQEKDNDGDCSSLHNKTNKEEEDNGGVGPHNNIDDSADNEADNDSLSHSKSDWSNHTANWTTEFCTNRSKYTYYITFVYFH